MTQPIERLALLLQHMTPVLNAGEYVFTTLDGNVSLEMSQVIACMREPEGMSVVLGAADAERLGFAASLRFAWITLQVHSDLNAVGLTSAFSGALGREGISCNVVAGHLHDHIFVPLGQSDAAMAALLALQEAAQANG